MIVFCGAWFFVFVRSESDPGGRGCVFLFVVSVSWEVCGSGVLWSECRSGARSWELREWRWFHLG
ncbi:hypothetical protein M758_5G041300 [Ceratodon purpureus]|uniref:Secreted protein n=1 Tax=Ceratodon purpureus TaxID=3225 RepID=A0A8T0HXS1_CERPU|nr:hypothetical protein KC19_5G041200 [Ceratodon purpureus]KAG0615442.1 hypothetical protein M758_5G041300 [Ceratodon purpureus]